ncbi:transmembrane protein 238a [Callorhinchus milii]|uniref:transmembrane protein 238a n=1 Tax=Callorhinchus milii TaxID=7868 RepID=UPI0004574FAA|nr:transmembrane protein 238a [Callorhinchus milii]XP_007905787.1 transmembrane protein 238a [Callorhinchus milii]|eukprot:gi/632978218/ref/XP_007905786.1/ PREDICTED: transmembrane protein 238-like [Callorhinchus milii]
MACTGLGRCKVALWFAVVLDILGLIALLVGIFAKLQREGRDFGDLLIYTGAIVVFVSLIGWVFWYTGNIEISWEELESDYQLKDNRLNRIVRKISRRISWRTSNGKKAAAKTAGFSCHPHKAEDMQLSPVSPTAPSRLREVAVE